MLTSFGMKCLRSLERLVKQYLVKKEKFLCKNPPILRNYGRIKKPRWHMHMYGAMKRFWSLSALWLSFLLSLYCTIPGPLGQYYSPVHVHVVLLNCVSPRKLRETGRQEQSWYWYLYLFHSYCIWCKFEKFLHNKFA